VVPDVMDDVVVHHVVVDHVMVRVAAGRQRQERRHHDGTRHDRQAEPLNLHFFPSDSHRCSSACLQKTRMCLPEIET
jgi:hypothetical protein